eukprot:3540916-Pyramimonas_sp.AAC.1
MAFSAAAAASSAMGVTTPGCSSGVPTVAGQRPNSRLPYTWAGQRRVEHSRVEQTVPEVESSRRIRAQGRLEPNRVEQRHCRVE